MKAILEFNLPEEREEFETAFKGINYYIALHTLRLYFRDKLKYSELSDAESKIIHELQEKFFEICRENEIEV